MSQSYISTIETTLPTSDYVEKCVKELSKKYSFLRLSEIGRSVMGKPLWCLRFGIGKNRVFYNASHHANEYITTNLLLKFIDRLCFAYASGGSIHRESAKEIYEYSTLALMPAVNPDGIDLVTGALTQGRYFERAREIAGNYPHFSFPSGWKANIEGVDLNLQYPAGWEQARENKFALGVTSPAPGDFVGESPLSAPESRAVYDYTLHFDPNLILAYHTQGEVIYWKYLGNEPFNSYKIARIFSALSGYYVEETPYASGFAGYKDWFIDAFDRPGYTIEAGKGTNPLPLSQFNDIYNRTLGIMTLATLVT